MTKLCPRGKAAAKRKFKVYPSAYANAYASKICAGKIKDPSGVKRKDFRGPKKAMGGMVDFNKISQDANSEYVRLEASKDILDRAGIRDDSTSHNPITNAIQVNIDLS